LAIGALDVDGAKRVDRNDADAAKARVCDDVTDFHVVSPGCVVEVFNVREFFALVKDYFLGTFPMRQRRG
jgi:hypothetical protein